MNPLSKRLTFSYVGDYSHLDEWEQIGSYEELGRDQLEVDHPGDITEPFRMAHHILVTSDADRETVRQALHDVFNHSGCAHDYDCCGCRSYQATNVVCVIKGVRRSLWRVEVYSSRNF